MLAPTAISELTGILPKLAEISQSKATGELSLTSNDSLNNDSFTSSRQWELYFFSGRLVYATDSKHRVRRWYRTLQICNSNLDRIDESSGSLLMHQKEKDKKGLQTLLNLPFAIKDQLWEYQLLYEAINQKLLSLHLSKAIIRTNTQEVFFNITSQKNLHSHWIARLTPLSETPFNLTLSPLEIEQGWQQAVKLWQQWQEKGLSHIYPHLAPTLKQYQSSQTGFMQYLSGNNTLWDIARQMQRSLIAVTNALIPFVEKGAIELREVADLPAPIAPTATSVNPSHIPKPLIACIDDSPVVAQSLEKILLPAGYRLLKITEPLTQMSTLVKEKPDLIFLDVVMPDTNGYSLCNFLRKTPTFGQTPIIILTSRDGIVDRTRAKLTGASDFLSKPPESEKVLQMIQKYLTV